MARSTADVVVGPGLLAQFVPMSGLSQEHCEQLAARASIIELESAASLAPSLIGVDNLLFLVEGSVRVVADEHTSESFTAGTEPARFSLPTTAPAGADVIAERDSHILCISRAEVSQMLVEAGASTEATPPPSVTTDVPPQTNPHPSTTTS